MIPWWGLCTPLPHRRISLKDWREEFWTLQRRQRRLLLLCLLHWSIMRLMNHDSLVLHLIGRYGALYLMLAQHSPQSSNLATVYAIYGGRKAAPPPSPCRGHLLGREVKRTGHRRRCGREPTFFWEGRLSPQHVSLRKKRAVFNRAVLGCLMHCFRYSFFRQVGCHVTGF